MQPHNTQSSSRSVVALAAEIMKTNQDYARTAALQWWRLYTTPWWVTPPSPPAALPALVPAVTPEPRRKATRPQPKRVARRARPVQRRTPVKARKRASVKVKK